MQNNNQTATAGEKSFYAEIQGKKITATNGNSNNGTGWRPVCGGKYLGELIYPSESAAIKGGKGFMDELKQRIKSEEKPVGVEFPKTVFEDYVPKPKKPRRSRKKDQTKND